jgi:hypothetical protein
MDLGDTLHFASDLYDKPAESGGVLVNAPTVALTITLPDGTTTSPTVTNPPATTGKYFYDYVTTTTIGRYTGQWLFTFVGGQTESYVQSFDVGSGLVTVDEALTHLRAQGIITTAADRDELQWFCLVASDAVERDLGIVVVPRTVVDTFDGGKNAVSLRFWPTLSITSLVESGITITSGNYLLDTNSNILYRGTNGYSLFSWGRQNVVVTYKAGYLNPPTVIRKVALNTIQEMWQASQQADHPYQAEFGNAGGFVNTASLTQVEQRAYRTYQSVGIG